MKYSTPSARAIGPSVDDIQAAHDILRKRHQPLAQPLAQWSSWSDVQRALTYRNTDDVQHAICSLAALMVTLPAVGRRDLFEKLHAKHGLLPSTLTVVRMINEGITLDAICAYVDGWTDSDTAFHVMNELCYRVWSLATEELDAEGHIRTWSSDAMEAMAVLDGELAKSVNVPVVGMDAAAAGRPKRKREVYRTPAEPGWIYLSDAARKFDINPKTLHYHRSKLKTADVRTDSESHEVMVRESALRARLDHKRRTRATGRQ